MELNIGEVEDRDKKELIRNNFNLQSELDKATKHIRNLLYVYRLGKNELATSRIMTEAEQFLKELESVTRFRAVCEKET